MKIYYKIYIFLILPYFVFLSNILRAENVRVGIESENNYTTVRIQSIVGKWQILFSKETASGTQRNYEEITPGDDIILMLIPKGIVMKMPFATDIDEGYDKIIINGGQLLSLELPEEEPKVLQDTIEITHDKIKLNIINSVSLDDYILSCSSSEIMSSEIEAVKAGIVAISTKANYLKKYPKHQDEIYDVCDKSHCISFIGNGANRVLVETLYPSIKNILLYYKNDFIYPRYHHTCGGKTSSALDVYGIDNEPYHISQSDIKDNKGSENCFHSPSFHWNMEIPSSSIEDFLSLEFAGGADNIFVKFEPIKINSEGRILMVKILGRKVRDIHGIDFMKHFQNFYGKNSMKSMRLNFELLKRSLIIKGMGEGDGVGMCLFGADGLAKKGMDYKNILSFYYPGIEIK